MESRPTEHQNAELFREFHFEHLRRQTKAIETIRNVVLTWPIRTVIGAFMLIAISEAPSSGF